MTVGGVLYANVIMSPVVGDVSGDGIPDVLVSVYAGTSLTNTVFVAIHGGTGETLWTVTGTSACTSQGAPALANLDPTDDALEIAYVGRDAALVVLDGDGTTQLARFPSATAAASAYAAPSIHDLDRDGSPEIILGARAFAFEGTPGAYSLRSLFNAAACDVNGAHSVVANLDDDPELEITCGGVAYDTDGSLMWPTTGAQVGYAAVADLDVDGAPEVVMVRSGAVTVRDGATGVMRMGAGGTWFGGTLAIPGGGVGGPPTIADFDGDGLPELSAAGQGAYAVYDPDCVEPRISGREAGACDRMTGTTGATRWSAPVQDLSSSRTGSSVFDFQGDGIAEVVYNDECFLHVFDGRDGTEILMEPFANSSRTGHEYPIVVDVDRDGNSEIVVPGNNDQIARDNCRASWRAAFGYATDAEIPERFRNGTQGIYVLGDPADRWVRTRPIWNQFAYAVTHVDDRGNVPATPTENWRTPGLNNFRQNVRGAGVFNAPNLTVELDVVAACGRPRGAPLGAGAQRGQPRRRGGRPGGVRCRPSRRRAASSPRSRPRDRSCPEAASASPRWRPISPTTSRSPSRCASTATPPRAPSPSATRTTTPRTAPRPAPASSSARASARGQRATPARGSSRTVSQTRRWRRAAVAGESPGASGGSPRGSAGRARRSTPAPRRRPRARSRGRRRSRRPGGGAAGWPGSGAPPPRRDRRAASPPATRRRGSRTDRAPRAARPRAPSARRGRARPSGRAPCPPG
ncbi:MAG: hypothetical protein M5U28_14980 [Sandaracinaceae bacterium]|nr:hypothetical protein [Sandaracinaceae bacterium]